MNELPARRRLVVPGSCLCTSGYGQHLPAVARMSPRSLEACAMGSRQGERLQSDLMQRDMWVMHSPAGAGWGGGVLAPSPHSPAPLRSHRGSGE
jgi:hypothetical protein